MNSFCWADLSSYSLNKSQEFYRSLFGWNFTDDPNYSIAHQGENEICGIYPMPSKFRNLGMPHFWMSYIQVDSVKSLLSKIPAFPNAKIEMTDEFQNGDIALIRDPQGAGFTIYDGSDLSCRSSSPGRLVWNELHLSDERKAIPFYQHLFGWEFVNAADGHYEILADQQHVSDLFVMPNSLKGKYEYWVCSFGVSDLAKSTKQIADLGGGILSEESSRCLVHDPSGEAFFYVQQC
ncbi:MAG: hypothetical protein AAF623_10070 [Planctomycetota bacterium]